MSHHGRAVEVLSVFVILLILLSGVLFQVSNIGSSRSATANDFSNGVKFALTVGPGTPGPIATLSLFNQAGYSSPTPAVSIAYFYQSGLLYSFGSARVETTEKSNGQLVVQASSPVDCSQSLTVSPSQGWTFGQVNQPALMAQNATSNNYVITEQSAIPGPATTSVLLGGVKSWPPGGAGLLLPPAADYRFTIAANGSGLVNATIVASYWMEGVGFTEFANSTRFTINTMSYQNMTVVSNGWGKFSAFLNSTSVLTAYDGRYAPNIGPVGFWVGKGWSMNYDAAFVKTVSSVSSLLPTGSCHDVTVTGFTPRQGSQISVLVPRGVTVQVLQETGPASESLLQLKEIGTWQGNATDLSLKAGAPSFMILTGASGPTITAIMLGVGISLLPPLSNLQINFSVSDATLSSG